MAMKNVSNNISNVNENAKDNDDDDDINIINDKTTPKIVITITK